MATRYVVRRGDTLWDIAGTHLGDPARWPEIFSYNNRPEVVAQSRTTIVDPDVILVGQTILLPGGNDARPAKEQPTQAALPPASAAARERGQVKARSGQPAGRTKAWPRIRPIPFGIDLTNLPSIPLVGATFVGTMKLFGSIIAQGKDAIQFVEITQETIKLKAQAAENALQQLASQVDVTFNAATGDVSVEWGIVGNTKDPPPLKGKLGAGVSGAGLPVLKASIAARDVKGEVAGHTYATAGLSIELEITPKPPTMQPVRIAPRAAPAASPTKLTGTMLIAGAGLLVVATVATDVLSGGLGIADDAISFALAARLLQAGIAALRPAAALAGAAAR